MSHFDTKFLSYALNLTKKHVGATSSNPAVGCVIVKNNEIIASAVTARNGRPHAEKIAIDSVLDKNLLVGATIYTTLEPCCHFGETPPCVQEIIKYKFHRIVIASKDYDARVNGMGIEILQKSDIEVSFGILQEKAKEVYKAFFKSRLKNIPYTTLKIATSLDGKIATKSFDSKWISSEKSRRFAHYLRANNDAILIGANTLRSDNPSLNCRLLGLEDFSPQIILITNSFNFNFESKIFDNNVIILTSKKDVKNTPKNSKIILCKEKNGLVDLQDALIQINKIGFNSLLIEGGGNISSQFLQENLIDELILIRSNKIIGNDGIAAIKNMNIDKIADIKNSFKRSQIKEFDDDVIEILTQYY